MRLLNATKRISAEIRRTAGVTHAHVARLLRRRRRIDTIEWQEVGSFAQLLGERRPSMLWLYDHSELPPQANLLFAELANEGVRGDHFRAQPQPTKVGLACLSNALVSGASSIGTSSVLYRLGPLAPLYVDQYLSENSLTDASPVGDLRLRGKAKHFLPGVSVLLTHWNSDVYGHWLLESMPKLLLLHRIANQLPEFRVVLPQTIPSWVINWITLVLPHVTIMTYNNRREYLCCETLLSPTLLMHPQHFFHPELASLLDELIRSVQSCEAQHDKVYVSRAAPSLYRELTNQAEIEEIAIDEGLTLVKPETMPLAGQIALFARANLVVGEFGSAMHNALFSAPGTKVLCLNWINVLQSRIAHLKGHEVGYLLPSEGRPVTYVREAARRSYHIDPQLFRTCLRTLIS